MIAAITQRIVKESLTGEIRDCLSLDWYPFLSCLGIREVYPVPNIGSQATAWIDRLRPDVIILSGGNDVEYGQFYAPDTSDPLNVRRDDTELSILKKAIEERVPVLGVCRGMQFIYAYFGGKLEKVEGHAGTEHHVYLTLPISGLPEHERIFVNSYHQYGIPSLLDYPLHPIAVSDTDRTVEAFIHEDAPILGMMWHPERRKSYSSMDIDIINTFLMKR